VHYAASIEDALKGLDGDIAHQDAA